ncbi:MAG: Tetratricopeptide 1 repeat-containing protein [Flavipsychrobacter sp.]|nr:Tetratricopeptide 1 repeat-containing protein [Flavipsychrobacter sp.]
MANSTRTLPGEERKINEEEINPLTVDKLESFYETNKKTISTALTVVLVIVVGYLGYTKLYKGPAEEKAATALSFSQRYFEADSLNLALNGDGKNLGFTKIAKKYSGTAAGNLAHYYEGICYLKMGDYPNAIKSLKDFDGKGTSLGAMATGLLGEAYMESGDKGKAIESFKKASADKDDVLVTPMFLYQLGMAYVADGKTTEAKDAFKRIRDEYPKSMHARDMDKELARLGELN